MWMLAVLGRSRKSSLWLTVPNPVWELRRMCIAAYKWTENSFQEEHIRLGERKTLRRNG